MQFSVVHNIMIGKLEFSLNKFNKTVTNLYFKQLIDSLIRKEEIVKWTPWSKYIRCMQKLFIVIYYH